jgi:hypothetical protein
MTHRFGSAFVKALAGEGDVGSKVKTFVQKFF